MADKEIQRDCEIEIIDDSDSENANLISQKSTNNQILFQTGWTKSSSNTIPHGWGDIPSPPPGGEIEKFNTGDSIRQVLSKWTPPTWSTPERPVIIFHNNKKGTRWTGRPTDLEKGQYTAIRTWHSDNKLGKRYNKKAYRYLLEEKGNKKADWGDKFFQEKNLFKTACCLVSSIIILFLTVWGYILYHENVKDSSGQRENQTFVSKGLGGNP